MGHHRLSLESKYTLEQGTVILTGVQALVRVPLDQHRADHRAGLHTATLISGYRGSPLGGFDTLLHREKELLMQHHVVFQPGVNEDLAATAIFGSQTVNLLPGAKYDGVLGMWYGKGPGVDRTGDVFRHANLAGIGPHGGVLAVAGDDPSCKSSTVPSHSEVALFDAQMPTLYPGTVEEVIEFGRYGFELSRYSGAWTGLKIVTDVADAYETAVVAPIDGIVRPEFTFDGKPWQPTQNIMLFAPFSLELERELYEGRLEAARLFAAANRLNRITVSSPDDRLGIVAAGKTYFDVREALQRMGLDDGDLRRAGIRLLKIGMVFPLEPCIVREFARGLEEIFVIEEKRGLIELFLRDVLYNLPERPVVVGKRDEHDRLLVRGDGELDPDQIVELLVRRFANRMPEGQLVGLERRDAAVQLPVAGAAIPARTPYFCSGCPHNRSTVVPEGSLAAGGIGCHTLALLMERNTLGVTHMGGEGAQWVGSAPFTEIEHLFQNLGDGTLFHSGYLAIRQAVAADVNITYKILYNGAVAMTGGQPADGQMALPDLTRALQAEGARRIIVCSDDPGKYGADAPWAPGVVVWERDRLDEAQRILRGVEGVTVLIYDQPCAAELQRKRKRGLAETPPIRVIINEAVCEGCGDCGVQSNCLSVIPVETEFGRKTQIHQSSCNRDYTCLKGDCPAFVTVIPAERREEAGKPAPRPTVVIDAAELPEPASNPTAPTNIYMIGIGGTGGVTINQILGTAALLEGLHVRSLDQTGLSQKGGPVVSHLKLLDSPCELSNRIGSGEADVYIAFDALTATTDKNLERAHPRKTVAVVSSSQIPTGHMVRSAAVHFPQHELLRRRIEMHTNAERNVYLDAMKLAEGLFGSHMLANMITIGAAYQAGLLPLSAGAIEQAIQLNGVAVKKNVAAFRVGRKLVADPEWQPLAVDERGTASPLLTGEARELVEMAGAEGELRRLLEVRVPELIAYQDAAYAQRYIEFVRRVRESEATLTEETRLSEAVARYLFKLMAYKDEYEVARLHLRADFHADLAEQFGPEAQITYHLHPPFLRALGMKRKLGLGRWFEAGYRLLTRMKRLRHTPLDVFGYAHVRRVERGLINEYRDLIKEELIALGPATYDRAVALASLPDLIRGYEQIKLENVAKFREEVRRIREESPLAAA